MMNKWHTLCTSLTLSIETCQHMVILWIQVMNCIISGKLITFERKGIKYCVFNFLDWKVYLSYIVNKIMWYCCVWINQVNLTWLKRGSIMTLQRLWHKPYTQINKSFCVQWNTRQIWMHIIKKQSVPVHFNKYWNVNLCILYSQHFPKHCAWLCPFPIAPILIIIEYIKNFFESKWITFKEKQHQNTYNESNESK